MSKPIRLDRSLPRTLIVGALLVVLPVAAGEAQGVRGIVRDAVDGSPGSGAVVTLARDGTDAGRSLIELLSVLADATGSYRLKAPGLGTYRVIVRRIGYRPFRSGAMVLERGEERSLDVQLEALSASNSIAELEPVIIARATPCHTARDEALRIAHLWSQARIALTATAITSRDKLASRKLVRFVRELDPKTLAVGDETVTVFDDMDVGGIALFRSLPGDSLSERGYWRRTADQGTTFYGPDADALLSEAFVRDHCFRVAERDANHLGMTGLVFEPVRQRNSAHGPPEVRGSVWLDSTSSELRSVDFVWTRLPGLAPTVNLGGLIRFSRSANGPWFVEQWRLRMPQDILEIQGSGDDVRRVRRIGIVEEGGLVVSDSLGPREGTSVLAGAVRDANRQPLANAVVRIVGTSFRAVTDAAGQYRLEGLPGGLASIAVDHESLSRLGVRVAEYQIVIDDSSRRTLSFRAPDHAAITERLCGRDARDRDRVALRVTALDSLTAAPVVGARIRLVRREGRDGVDTVVAEGETNSDGSVVFCSAPVNDLLFLDLADGPATTLETFSLQRGLVAGRVLLVDRRRGSLASRGKGTLRLLPLVVISQPFEQFLCLPVHDGLTVVEEAKHRQTFSSKLLSQEVHSAECQRVLRHGNTSHRGSRGSLISKLGESPQRSSRVGPQSNPEQP